jgi:Ni/Fe-hydrogenase subunit HybB-like protein
MAHETSGIDAPAVRLESVPTAATGGAIAMIVVGFAAFALALFGDPDRAWHAYLINWLYFTGIAQGAVMLAVVVTITKGMWSRNMRRVAISFASFLPIALLLLLPMLFVTPRLFPWVLEPVAGKEAWLNVPFLIVRQMILLGTLFGLSMLFARWALRPDLGLMRERVDGKLAELYGSLTRNWRGQEAEEAIAHKRLAVLSPVLGLVYAVAFGVVAWDFIMSLEPHWFSTLIGPFFFMAAFLSGLAATGIVSRWVARQVGHADTITITQYHDLGKLTFGFVVFWGYLFFSQYIVIWYGLLPGEQSFVVHRFSEPFGIIAKTVFLCVFIIPFFGLLGAAPKRNPRILTLFGGLILLGLWLERYLLVYPSYHIGATDVPLGWQEIGIGLFFAGLLILSVLRFLHRYPVFQLWQPMSELELQGVEVEVAEGAGAA